MLTLARLSSSQRPFLILRDSILEISRVHFSNFRSSKVRLLLMVRLNFLSLRLLYLVFLANFPAFSGEPGADRVVFSTPDCFLAGELTMQGQRAGQYTECTEEY
jgi:hypothetical protein